MLWRNFEYLFSSLGTRGHQWYRDGERDWFYDLQQYRQRPQSLSCDSHLSCYWKSFGISIFGRARRLNYFFQVQYASHV